MGDALRPTASPEALRGGVFQMAARQLDLNALQPTHQTEDSIFHPGPVFAWPCTGGWVFHPLFPHTTRLAVLLNPGLTCCFPAGFGLSMLEVAQVRGA